MNTTNNNASSEANVQDLVIERDTGARSPTNWAGTVLSITALCWSIFQLWIASPLPFYFDFLIFNNTEARSIHLAFAMFLAFTAYPTFASSPRSFIPFQDWAAALIGAFCALYIFIFYNDLASRSGITYERDMIVAAAGIVLLLEAARRSLGLPLMIMGALFLAYTYFGSSPMMPDLIQHKGQSLEKIANHQWLSTEGVYGVALGVSTSFVFLFVLFGALLDKAGAGNYFIKVAFSLMGHLRGGPAKAAVLASGLTGFISGSSIANVVTTGTFTIPLMKRVGFESEKAGAIEVAGSVNGQIMPPVMGAAAFIMMDFVGISLQEVVRHAFLPAVISYIALIYIVHLEALKAEMTALEKPKITPLKQTLLVWGIILSSVGIIAGGAFYVLDFLSREISWLSPIVICLALGAWYLLTLRYAAKYPDLEPDDPTAELVQLPETAPTVKTGLHFLIPVVVLVWALMVERLSPGLSAFWATTVMMVILVTQRPLKALFRGETQIRQTFRQSGAELKDGLIAGARNMIGIAIATAAAGIIVGTVSQTGIGQIMTEVVETLSGGSLILVLVFTAIISLILGMGLPTTANYMVVASIMVGVVQELGKQHGLILPAIAIHLFVFYFGIMADVTPPVGLASFASAAISKGDPIKTGLQAFIYSTRTAILPFFFVFNNSLLMIGVETFWEGAFVFLTAVVGILLFSAAMQGYFLTRSRIYESALLLLVSVTFFVPQALMDQIVPSSVKQPPGTLFEQVMEKEPGDTIQVIVEGENMIGEYATRHIMMPVTEGVDANERLERYGMILRRDGKRVYVDDVVFASEAEDAGIYFDNEIKAIEVSQPQPNPKLLYLPALLVLLLIVLLQRRRCSRVYIQSSSQSKGV